MKGSQALSSPLKVHIQVLKNSWYAQLRDGGRAMIPTKELLDYLVKRMRRSTIVTTQYS
jgi:hypothetical protein